MIKLLTSIAGADFSYAAGEKVSLDKDYERRLVDSGQAEEVKSAKKTVRSANKSGSKPS